MTLISFLAASAAAGLALSVLDLSLSAPSLGVYAAAASLLVALGAVRDYRPRRSYWEPSHGTVTRFPGATTRPETRLAA